MKAPIVILAITLFALAFSRSALVQGVIPDGYSLNSPDRRFVVHVKYENLNFKDNHNQRSYPSVAVLTPIRYMKWTGDSRTLVVIEHIAGGGTG
jgi:hypothetical protein